MNDHENGSMEEIAKLREEYNKFNTDRKTQEKFYWDKFFPLFSEYFSTLAIHQAPGDWQEPKALISLMGFSPEPIVLMARRLRPEHMLLLGTKKSFSEEVRGQVIPALIAEKTGLGIGKLWSEIVDEQDETTIYQAIKKFMKDHDLSPRELAIDPTGGKKSMTAAASAAATMLDIPMVYVDYAEYVSGTRRPLIGSEFPRFISNPVNVLGYLDFENAFAAFNRGDFAEAESIAVKLKNSLDQPQQADALLNLVQAYQAWQQFDFNRALKSFSKYLSFIAERDPRQKWSVFHEHVELYQEHHQLLDVLASPAGPADPEKGKYIIINHLAASKRTMDSGRFGIAILLIYSTLERFIDLILLHEYGLHDEKPDYSLIADRMDMDKFHQIGRDLIGENIYMERELNGPISFALGLQILLSFKADLVTEKDMKNIKTMMQKRNKSPYEHGLKFENLEYKELEKYYKTVKSVMGRHYNDMNIDEELKKYAFPSLRKDR